MRDFLYDEEKEKNLRNIVRTSYLIGINSSDRKVAIPSDVVHEIMDYINWQIENRREYNVVKHGYVYAGGKLLTKSEAEQLAKAENGEVVKVESLK